MGPDDEGAGKALLFDEDEIVDRIFAFSAGAEQLPRLPPDVVSRATDRSGPLAEYLYEELNQFLRDPDLASEVKVSEQRLQHAAGQKLELFRRKKGRQTDKIVIYRVKGSLIPTALSLVGLTFGILLMSPTLPLTVFGFLHGQAKRFVVLQRENDSAAIRVYEAFARLRVDDNIATPSTSQFIEKLDSHPDEVRNGLTSLLDKQVLRVSSWGAETNDYLHPNTRWKLPL